MPRLTGVAYRSDANDPKRTKAGLKSRGAAVTMSKCPRVESRTARRIIADECKALRSCA